VILSLGIDLLETSRVEQELSRGAWLLADGIFTPEEITYCSSAKKPALRYAACFAAKEAILKALGVQVSDLALYREVELSHAGSRGYRVVLHDRLRSASERLGVQNIFLSISNHGGQTGAVVIIEAGTSTEDRESI
jgi:holo-[acyl-carrier protein] synthase